MTARQVKAARQRLQLTQEQLGKALGVTRNAVNQWEMGVRRISEPTARLLTLLLKMEKPS